MATANEIRKTLTDVGQYPLYSSAVIAVGQAVDLRLFSYKLGDALPGGGAGVIATELETNVETAGQLGSSYMNVESIGLSWWGYSPLSVTGAAAYYPTLADIERFDAHCMVRFEVNQKVMQHGRFTMFPAGHGAYGQSVVAGAEVLSNGVPSFQARVRLQDPIELEPTDSFVCILRFPRGAIVAALGGPMLVTAWLFGPRSRKVV